jgi:predicted nucleic acid-binding protein
MNEAISDTGPILHLFEIDTLYCLRIFERVYIPSLVASELEDFGVEIDNLSIPTKIVIVPVDQRRREQILQSLPRPPIHPADAEVLVLGQDRVFPRLVLTDDMALRRHLEHHGLLVVGSVGILVRAYHQGMLSHTTLSEAINALLTQSTLHLSSAFRIYVRNLIDHLG